MTSRDPLSIQVEPPDCFDGRSFERWTAGELMSLADELQERAHESDSEGREELLRKESDVFRCLGRLSIVLAPRVELLNEWKQAIADGNAATPYSTEHIDALTRQAEIQRACGAELMGYARDYQAGAEPIP